MVTVVENGYYKPRSNFESLIGFHQAINFANLAKDINQAILPPAMVKIVELTGSLALVWQPL